MKSFTHAVALATLTLFPVMAQADDVLWNLDFKTLAPGQPPVAAPFTAPSPSPQRVMTDAQNTIVAAQAVGPLQGALLYDKETTAHYLPAMMLTAPSGYTSGVVTIQFDLVFDRITPSAAKPVETLMAFPLVKDNGGMDVILVAACAGPDTVNFGIAGVPNGGGAKVAVGQVAHLKAVMDLDKHTLQVFVNDAPLGAPIQDDVKFASFRGITVRDGTALGGNAGATFTAGLANIVITKG